MDVKVEYNELLEKKQREFLLSQVYWKARIQERMESRQKRKIAKQLQGEDTWLNTYSFSHTT